MFSLVITNHRPECMICTYSNTFVRVNQSYIFPDIRHRYSIRLNNTVAAFRINYCLEHLINAQLKADAISRQESFGMECFIRINIFD